MGQTQAQTGHNPFPTLEVRFKDVQASKSNRKEFGIYSNWKIKNKKMKMKKRIHKNYD